MLRIKITAGSTLMSEPRVRFNSGYWDGRADQKVNRYPRWADRGACLRGRQPKHPFDEMYGQGYWIGRTDTEVTETSDNAWNNRPKLRRR